MATKKDIDEQLIRKAARNHPLKNLVYFILAGITMLFFALMTFFAFSRPAHFFTGQHFPRAFIVSTLIIVVSSFTMEQARRAYNHENGRRLLNYLMLTLLLALGFGVAQVLGWEELWGNDITIFGVGGISDDKTRTPSGAFLFLISGLHLLHLAGGLIFLFLSSFKVVNVSSDDVRSVIYFADLLERTRIEMLAKYWHFLGGLWFLLFLYFLWFFV